MGMKSWASWCLSATPRFGLSLAANFHGDRHLKRGNVVRKPLRGYHHCVLANLLKEVPLLEEADQRLARLAVTESEDDFAVVRVQVGESSCQGFDGSLEMLGHHDPINVFGSARLSDPPAQAVHADEDEPDPGGVEHPDDIERGDHACHGQAGEAGRGGQAPAVDVLWGHVRVLRDNPSPPGAPGGLGSCSEQD
jgi:hypothetical protein